MGKDSDCAITTWPIFIRFHLTCLLPRISPTLASFEIFDKESTQLIHIRARLESYLRYAVNAPPSRCLSARSLFHCASNLGARIGSAVFRQIPPPILPRPAHLLYIYDSEETTRYLVACDARSNKVNRGPGQYRLPCIFYFKDNYFKE